MVPVLTQSQPPVPHAVPRILGPAVTLGWNWGPLPGRLPPRHIHSPTILKRRTWSPSCHRRAQGGGTGPRSPLPRPLPHHPSVFPLNTLVGVPVPGCVRPPGHAHPLPGPRPPPQALPHPRCNAPGPLQPLSLFPHSRPCCGASASDPSPQPSQVPAHCSPGSCSAASAPQPPELDTATGSPPSPHTAPPLPPSRTEDPAVT